MTDPLPDPRHLHDDEVAHAWEQLVATARRTVADRLVVGTSGNVSVRVGDLVLVTPSGVPYDRLTPDDVTGVDLDGRQVLGTLTPTSELPMHLAVHRTTDARAVGHTHAVHATAVSTLMSELPPVHYMTGALGGPVRVAPYATYGTEELARNMLEALTGRTACLLQNHGTLAHAATLDEAYDRTAQLGVDVPPVADRGVRPRPYPEPADRGAGERGGGEAEGLRPAVT
ncbi:L-fuculose-phosphate aldolase [Streptomyces phaeoluteigriseus]